ncbi:MAG TPA: Holliday junction branch migration DNA helicase RuvB [Leptospiraceae bacterium]|nr:Holliday junction branch migration DNA helicase RuvB [Leptospiraceae bacterium]HMY67488.1 Holliday junction branch migration DNA helicase RuvB [Leptospiraceae bacterium]HNF15977.1 Holliday junction branch migration DNA helicase RuvB [Leptospiraceae bacterium]HNH08376.1 Holliday junction branch migration DNA helicase RuvB [Leptospiraceae bacterium]HNI97664.1 Holliday junction branch migration DNA helicase RuvB [Leptospiraceae bacterium]
MKERLVNPENKAEEDIFLRPSSLDEFIGQKEILENLKVFIHAARKRGKALDHVLLSGPPGLGKTTLANIISKEIGSNLTVTSAQVISKGADLARFLTVLSDKDILFIDEIHSLGRGLEEILYPAMEDFQIDIVIGEGITAQSVQIPLQPFTLVGATTRSGLISEPLKNRFGIQLRLEYYTDEEMQKIVERSAKLMNLEIEKEASFEIGKRSRKTPRIANHLLKRVRDFADVQNEGRIDLAICRSALEKLGIDSLGLDSIDRQILECIVDRYRGGPVGLKPIAVVIGEEEKTVEETYEPYLVRIGLINRTPSGRTASEKAYEHLGRKRENQERTLFS